MAKGEITVDENLCRGCGFCANFCARGCIEISNTLGTQGYLLAQFAHPEKCNACGICGWMCPDCAIKVYKDTGDENA